MADPHFRTHTAFYNNMACDQDLNIIENVPEYPEKIIQDALGPAFVVTAVKIDPRIFGLAVARARIYAIAFRKSKLRWRAEFSVNEFLDAMTSQVSLTSTNYWFRKLPRQVLSDSDDTWVKLRSFMKFELVGPFPKPESFSRSASARPKSFMMLVG